MTPPSMKSQCHLILRHYFEDLETVLRDAGLGAEYRPLLADHGLSPEVFEASQEGLSYGTYLAVLHSLDQKGWLPGLGLRLGDRKRHGTFGLTGLNMLTQGTLGQANSFAAESFEFCWGQFLSLKFSVEGDWAFARYEPSRAALAQDVALIEQALVTGIRMVGELLPDLDWSPCRGLFAYPAPAHADLYPRYLPFPCAFDQPFNGWRVPAAWAERAPRMADEDVRHFCELRFRAMVEEGSGPDGLARQIRRILADAEPACPPGAQEIAHRLNLPLKVVQEKLTADGTSMRAILNDILMDKARQLLADPRLSAKEVAFRLGYAQPPSFHRAFVRNMGQTPKQYQARPWL